MADSSPVKDVVDRFLERQREMYAGGDLGPVEELLDEDVVWHVPGTSPIAGDYRGREAVLGYFRTRRALAGGAIAVTKHQEMHHDDVLVQLADGSASPGGRDIVWRTAGVYRIRDGRIAEAWLVPLELEAFDRAWQSTRARPFVHTQRVRAQECAGSTMLGHTRLLEFFEAAFIAWWHARAGSPAAGLGPDRRLMVAAVDMSYLAPVRAGDELRIEVVADRITTRSLHMHYDAYVGDLPVARARSRYVCIDAGSDRCDLPDLDEPDVVA